MPSLAQKAFLLCNSHFTSLKEDGNLNHSAGGAGGGLLLGGTTTPGLPPGVEGVPGVPGWGPGPDPQLALGGTGLGFRPPTGPMDLPEGGLFSMEFRAALFVRLQATCCIRLVKQSCGWSPSRSQLSRRPQPNIRFADKTG